MVTRSHLCVIAAITAGCSAGPSPAVRASTAPALAVVAEGPCARLSLPAIGGQPLEIFILLRGGESAVLSQDPVGGLVLDRFVGG